MGWSLGWAGLQRTSVSEAMTKIFKSEHIRKPKIQVPQNTQELQATMATNMLISLIFTSQRQIKVNLSLHGTTDDGPPFVSQIIVLDIQSSQ